MARLLFFVGSLAAALLLNALLPDHALAWGPGVHMVTGNWVLQNLSALPLPVAGLLMQHPGQFLHGSLSADIFIGKGSKAKKGHSHNWESGFSLLARAVSLQERAYAYGYLAHLAADTVAHNVFVPGLFHTAPGAGRLAHVYLEIQADRLLAWDKADALGVFRGKESLKTDSMLCRNMSRRSLPFRLQARLYRGSIALCGSRLWKSSMAFVDGLLPEHERAALLDRMMTLSARAMVSILRLEKDSPVLALDPIGAKALDEAGKRGGKTLCASDVALRCMRLGKTGTAATGGNTAIRVRLPEVLEHVPPVCTTLRDTTP